MTQTPVIGIHLGGSTCSVAAWLNDEQRPQIVSNERGTRAMPACVAYTDRGVLVGQDAVDQQRDNSRNTIYGLKTLLGRSYDDPIVRRGMKEWPFKVISKDDRLYVQVEISGKKKYLTPEEIVAVLFTKLKQIAESYVGQPVVRATICGPDLASDSTRIAIKAACEKAGIETIRVVNEALAAMLAHGLDKLPDEYRSICVHLGRSNLDITAFWIDFGFFESKASHKSNVAGAEFDARLAAHFAKEFSVALGRDLAQDADAMQRLTTASEYAKIELSTATEATVQLYVDGDVLVGCITRARFEELIQDLISCMKESLAATLAGASWSSDNIDKVVLTGGGAFMPWVQRFLADNLPSAALYSRSPIVQSPDEAAVLGAVLQGASMCGLDGSRRPTELVFLDVVPLSIGVELDGGLMHVTVPRNTTMPFRKRLCFSTASDAQTQVTFALCSGERVLAKDNYLRQVIKIENLPALPKGALLIEMEFTLDADGHLTVAAVITSPQDFQKYQVLYAGKQELSHQQIEENVSRAQLEQSNPNSPEAAWKAREDLRSGVDSVKERVEREDVSRSRWTNVERAAVLAAVTEAQEWLTNTVTVMHPRAVYVDRLRDFQLSTSELVSMNAAALRFPM